MFTLLAPAKINWSLSVLDLRSDGYHNILSLLQCIELFDEIRFESSQNIEVISNTDIPAEQNLVYKSALALKKHYGIDKGARIILTKSIPTGAGLGGGSSDAAHTLMGLNNLWGLRLDRGELMTIGERIGSDVPFFFHCPIGVAKGRGELVTPLNIETSYTLLLVKPPVAISTSWAYEMLKLQRAKKCENEENKTVLAELTKNGNNRDNIRLIYKALVQSDFSLLRDFASNDFESIITANFSIIGKIKNELLDSGAYIAMMTGSGSVVFGLFNNRREALIASKKFKSFWHRVVDTLKSN